MRRHMIVRVRRGFGSPCSSDSLWQGWCLQTDLDHQLNSDSSDTLVQLASGISEQVLRSAVWWVMFRERCMT